MPSFLLELYFIQVLITIWKELNGKDEYTPYLTNSSINYASDVLTPSWDDLKENTAQYNPPKEFDAQPSKAKWINWKYCLSCRFRTVVHR